MLVERAAQRLLGHPQLLRRPVNADLVGQLKRLLGGGAVLQEPGALGHRRPSPQPDALLGGGAGEDAVMVVVGLGAVQGGVQAGQAAELALTRTQAREHQPSPAADDARRPAQTGQPDQRRILSTLGVIATTVVVAMTWRRRARSRRQERA